MPKIMELPPLEQTYSKTELLDEIYCLKSEMITFVELVGHYLDTEADHSDVNVDFTNTFKHFIDILFCNFEKFVKGGPAHEKIID